MNTPEELWRPIAGFEGHYEISSLGRVWSRYVNRALVPAIEASTGYPRVSLSAGGRQRPVRVHRLVAAAFLGLPPEGKPNVCHRDGDPANNAVTNLYYGSQAENIRDTVRHGRHKGAVQTHCVNGHPLSGANLRVSKRQRICRACIQASGRRYRERKRSEQALFEGGAT